MKNLIYQFHIGKVPEYAEKSIKCFETYAALHGIDYTFDSTAYYCDDEPIPPSYFENDIFFEKQRLIFDPIFDQYDNILYVDTDILVNNYESNIFDEVEYEWVRACTYPAKRKIYLNIFKSRGVSDDLLHLETMNCGVLLMSKKFRHYAREHFYPWQEHLKDCKDWTWLEKTDEAYMSVECHNHHIPVAKERLTTKWNAWYHFMKQPDHPLAKQQNNFIHFVNDDKDVMLEYYNKNILHVVESLQ